MVGDLVGQNSRSVQNFSSVRNFRPLGVVEAYDSYNGVVSEGHFVCCLELLRN